MPKFFAAPKPGKVQEVQEPYEGTEGRVYDLQEIFERLNAEYFKGSISATVKWGRAHPKPARPHNSITLGRYTRCGRLITIHRRLDRKTVDPLFLDFVMYHEMLHQKHDARIVRGKQVWHTPEFTAEEQRFKHYDHTTKWYEKNLAKLLVF
jgi:hypothetical protein